jgi:hypothetical protein
MNKKILFAFFLLLLFANITAQDDNELYYVTRPFQVTFVPPLGTNGVESSGFINKLSINILAGHNGGVDGFEAGSVLNLTEDNVKGVQLSGFGNIAGGPVEAVQVAGFMNIDRHNCEGVQAAGFINYVDGYARAIQAGGFANLSAGLKGIQVSGFANVADEAEGVQVAGFLNAAASFNGIQVAGFLNGADDFDGVQVAGFLNGTDDFKGIQVAGFLNGANNFEGIQVAGFLNVANRVKGIQIAGFLNVCDTIDGIPIALISIVKRGGYRRFELWGNETFFMNTSFKIGVKQFYTIFSLGYKTVISDFNTGIGIGAGTNIDINGSNSIDIDINSYYINKNFWEYRDYNMLNSLKISFNYKIAEHFSIFAGPAVNLLVSDYSDSADEIAPAWAFKISNRKQTTRGWFGFNVGMGF